MKTVISIIFSLFIVVGIPHRVTAQSITEKGELTLTTAIDRSLENATNIRIAKAYSDGAEASSSLLSSDYIPKISSSLSYSLSQYPQIVTPIRQQGVFPPLDDQIFEANIQADWEIFDFGESRAIRQKAKSLADAANIKYDLARMETIESTTSAFIQLQQLRELKQVQKERIKALKENKEQLQSLYREGRVAKVDLLKIDDTIVEAETAIIATDNNIDQVLQRLSDDLAMEQVLALDDITPMAFKKDYLFNPDQTADENVPSIKIAREQK